MEVINVVLEYCVSGLLPDHITQKTVHLIKGLPYLFYNYCYLNIMSYANCIACCENYEKFKLFLRTSFNGEQDDQPYKILNAYLQESKDPISRKNLSKILK